MNEEILQGRLILIVEDDFFVVQELQSAVEEIGAGIEGPAADVASALKLIASGRKLDGAVLDINLQGEMVFPVAEELARRGVPFVFSTGYDRTIVPEVFGEVPQCEKPLDADRVISTLAQRMRDPASEARSPAAAEPMRRPFLDRLASDDRAILTPHLERVELRARDVLVEENKPIPYVYFPETAVLAILAVAEGARAIEAGVVGFEGSSDLVRREGDRAPLRTIVVLPGSAMRIDAREFVRIIRMRPTIQRLVSAYRETLALQFAFAALSHGTSTIDARLARWILMLDDRVADGAIPIVHNYIADILAVRRSGVTTALHVLEGLGAIRSLRGMVVVRDRAILKQLAGGAYGVAEAEFERIMMAASEPRLRVTHSG